MTSSVLIVDDDVELGTKVEQDLSSAGYETRFVTSVPAARKAWSEAKADLCLVDIVMPGPSGRVFCGEIQTGSDAAVIMMSSLADSETIIALLDIGADDYLTKPFDLPELQARVRAVLRRRVNRKIDTVAKTLHIGAWDFDLEGRRLSRNDGLTVPLTQAEASVLRFLAQSPGVVFSREDLLAVARTRQHAGKDDRAVDTLIKRLRRKVELDPANPSHILTEWGKGYSLQP